MSSFFGQDQASPGLTLFLPQACIAGALTEGDDDEGPCPKCKKTVNLADLSPIGGVEGESGSAGGEGNMSVFLAVVCSGVDCLRPALAFLVVLFTFTFFCLCIELGLARHTT